MAVTFYHHPEYTRNAPLWKIYNDLYEGDQGLLRSPEYLPAYTVESMGGDRGKQAYAGRQSRTFYTNFCEPIISLWIAKWFSRPINWGRAEEILTEEEMEDIDGKGSSLEQFIKGHITRNYLLFGSFYAWVDVPNVPAELAIEEKAKGKRIYATLWNPLFVPDWSNTEAGKLNAVHYQYAQVAPRASLQAEPKIAIYRRALYLNAAGKYESQVFRLQGDSQQAPTFQLDPFAATATAYTTSSLLDIKSLMFPQGGSWEPVGDPKTGELDFLPVVAGGMGSSFIRDVAPEILRYHQLQSSYENILHFQGYTRVAIAGEPLEGDSVGASENSAIWLKQGSEVFDIRAEDPSALERRLKDVMNNILRIGLNQFRQLDASSKESQSADTMREEKENFLDLVKESVEEIEDYANELLSYCSAFRGNQIAPEDIGVEFDSNFDKQSVEEFLQLYQALGDVRRKSPTLAKYSDKKLVTYMEPPTELVPIIESEIDKAPAEPQVAQRQDTATLLRQGLARGA